MKRAAPALLLVLVASCAAPPPASTQTGALPTAPAGGPVPTFVLASTAGLLTLDQDCRVLGQLVQLPRDTAPSTAALSPDRKRIAFTLTQSSKTAGFGSDIYEVNVDGTGLRALLEHETDNVFYVSPRYDPTGNFIYVQRRSAVIQGGQYVGNLDTIDRVDLATRKRTTVVKDGADPTVSPDGKSLVYIHLKDSLPDGLWTVSLPDGGDAKPFLRSKDTFFYMQTPRFSPSGGDIVFSAAGRVVGARGGPKLAHLSVPSELFLVPADGSKITSLAPTGDDVVPTWSPDGTKIAYVGLGSFVILTVADRTTKVCAQGETFFFGDPVWIR